MDTLSAFARGQASGGRELMVFDWEKAAQTAERNPKEPSAGLQTDVE